MPIFFHNDEISFDLKGKRKIKDWINAVIAGYDKKSGDINYVFCSDESLYNINKQRLKHNYYTDIITFDLSESETIVEGDLFLSIDRIRDNSLALGESFDNELYRVMIHGILHLLGYRDKTDNEQQQMRQQENKALKLFLSRP